MIKFNCVYEYIPNFTYNKPKSIIFNLSKSLGADNDHSCQYIPSNPQINVYRLMVIFLSFQASLEHKTTCHINFPSHASSVVLVISPSSPILLLVLFSSSSTRQPYPAMHVTVATGTIFSPHSYLACRIKFLLMT